MSVKRKYVDITKGILDSLTEMMHTEERRCQGNDTEAKRSMSVRVGEKRARKEGPERVGEGEPKPPPQEGKAYEGLSGRQLRFLRRLDRGRYVRWKKLALKLGEQRCREALEAHAAHMKRVEAARDERLAQAILSARRWQVEQVLLQEAKRKRRRKGKGTAQRK